MIYNEYPLHAQHALRSRRRRKRSWHSTAPQLITHHTHTKKKPKNEKRNSKYILYYSTYLHGAIEEAIILAGPVQQTLGAGV